MQPKNVFLIAFICLFNTDNCYICFFKVLSTVITDKKENIYLDKYVFVY